MLSSGMSCVNSCLLEVVTACHRATVLSLKRRLGVVYGLAGQAHATLGTPVVG